jgi:chemotaxis protein CheY-P-specific phosphatase CheC
MFDDKKIIYKNDLHKAAAVAAERATNALKKLISPKTRLIVADIEALEKPLELDAQKLAKRCIEYYRQDKITISADVKFYSDDGSKNDGGIMLMFIDKGDYHAMGRLILSRIANDEERFSAGMEDSAVTEALNIIGNAYINVIADHYQITLMSMVPKVVTDISFDSFVGDIVSGASEKTYVLFDTNLIITESVIRIPFLLAVALPEQLKAGTAKS